MIRCPVCAKYNFAQEDDYDVCPVCEWENDSLQLKDPSYWGGANDLSLNDYKKEWQRRSVVAVGKVGVAV